MPDRNRTVGDKPERGRGFPVAAMLLAALLILGAMAFLTWNVVHKVEQKMRAGLQRQIRDSSQAVDIDMLMSLTGEASDANRPEYRYLKEKFEFAIQMNSNLRYIYLLGRKPDGGVFFFMDTGQPGDRGEEARPGEVYHELPEEVVRVFDNGAETVIGPYTDRWGVFVSGLAPLVDPETGNVAAIMGMDVDYRAWSRNVFFAAAPLAAVFVGALLLFSLILAFLVYKLSASLRQRDAAANALQKQKDRYKFILEGTDVGTWEWNVQTGEAIFNERFVDLAGYAPAEIAPISFGVWEALAHPDDLKAGKEALQRHLRGETNLYAAECRIKHKDGRWIWVLDRGKVISRTQDGEPLWVYGTRQDITERKQTEQALLESEELQRKILQAVPDLIVRTDLEGTITFVNELAFPGLENLPEQSICGRSIFSFMTADDASQAMEHARQRLERNIGTREYRLRFDGGLMVDAEINGAVISDQESVPVGMVYVIRDVTERKRAIREQEKLHDQLLQARKMESLGVLTGGVAHDFNNLLHVMRGNIELLLQCKSADAADAKRLRMVSNSMDRAAQLVQQLLFFSRKSGAKRVRVDLNSEVQNVVRILERTIPKMIVLDLRLDSLVYPLFADPVQIEQILLNLAGNAVDAMPEGGRLTIETSSVILNHDFVRRHPGSTVGPHALLTVSDEGCGMDQEVLAHIYDPFFTTKEVGKGTGLGLASVYGIVQAHGGWIQCRSEPGRGARFEVYLPAGEKAGSAAEALGPENHLQGGNEAILVVDDEPEIRELSREVLESLGYVVTGVSTGEEAVGIIAGEARAVDLVLLDLNMPGMGGYKCLDELLRLAPHVNVIIVSGYSADGRIDKALASGARAFLGKPYRMGELAKVVREVLDARPEPMAEG